MAGQRRLAEEVRTRLELVKADSTEGDNFSNNKNGRAMARSLTKRDELDELYFGKKVRQHLKEFGALCGVLLTGYGAWQGWHYHSIVDMAAFTTIGVILAVVGYAVPRLLHKPWKAWMGFAKLLSFVITPVIMTVLWFLVVVPFSLALKIFRVKNMDTSFKDDSAKSFWIVKEPKEDEFKLLERQF